MSFCTRSSLRSNNKRAELVRDTSETNERRLIRNGERGKERKTPKNVKKIWSLELGRGTGNGHSSSSSGNSSGQQNWHHRHSQRINKGDNVLLPLALQEKKCKSGTVRDTALLIIVTPLVGKK